LTITITVVTLIYKKKKKLLIIIMVAREQSSEEEERRARENFQGVKSSFLFAFTMSRKRAY
jgi:hypothetical protein